MAELTLTWFDGLVIALVAVSALMGFARGFLREVTSLVAFAVAAAAAYYAVLNLQDVAAANLPQDWPPIAVNAILAVAVFSVAFVLAAWFGNSLAKAAHKTAEIGALDRIFGLAFGAARGAFAAAVGILLLRFIMPADAVPVGVLEAETFPYLSAAADWLEGLFPASDAPSMEDQGQWRQSEPL